MGFTKRLIELQEEQRDVATQIALDSGVLKRCEFHGEIYDPETGDKTPAYKLGNFRLSAGKLGKVFSSSREMTDMVKAVIDDAAMECYICAKEESE